jgi:hypothetical protein
MILSGTDNICSTILKAIANEIADPFAHCVNLSLSLGSVPKMAKISKIAILSLAIKMI